MDTHESGYNGWTNYETWVVSLWLDNDEATHYEARSIVHGTTNYQAANNLKDWVTDMAPDLGGTLWADLLGAALSEVDWLEIAENYQEELLDA